MKKCDGDSEAFFKQQPMIINQDNFKCLICPLFYIFFFLSFSYQKVSAQDSETSKTLVIENSLDQALKQIEQVYSVRIF